MLAGLILLASCLQGYLSTGQADLLIEGTLGLVMMIIYGVAGGFVGGAVVALVYNRMLGAAHGIIMDLEIRKKP
jgi:hypothetical protein